ncbi:MAG: Gfo/Idh/MocA family oxidoreductase, partial [Armatimonadetes bacterium]|nr:Gfo/Idh/MocA family oxidoreductase [Armatimonadota bacterium]
MPDPQLTRRSFLRGAVGGAAAAAAFSIVPSRALGADGQTPASDQLTHAVIGIGGMGNGHLDMCFSDRTARLLAVCDVDSARLAAGLKRCGDRGTQGYHDFREVLDRGDIDIVHIVTPPHWHALISVMAAQAGCDIWCEKPMTRTIGEGRHVIKAVRDHGRMFRLNTWFRLYSGFYGLGTPVKPLKQLVAAGLLGWPLTVRASAHTGFGWKTRQWSGMTNLKPEPVPAELDYDFWLGPAPFKPYSRHRTHGSFRGYWDYDGGGLADMGQHYLDPVQYLLDKDGTSPVEIEAEAPWPAHPDAVGLWGRVTMAYADGCRIILESCEWGDEQTKGQPYLEGPQGKVYQGFRTDPPDLRDAIASLPEPEPMVSDFNESVKTRRPFGLNEANGNRSNLLVHLANAAIRTGRKLRFDPAAQRFLDDDGANRQRGGSGATTQVLHGDPLRALVGLLPQGQR